MKLVGITMMVSALVLCFIRIKPRFDYSLRTFCMLIFGWGMLLLNRSPSEFAWQMMLGTMQLFTIVGILCALVSIASAILDVRCMTKSKPQK